VQQVPQQACAQVPQQVTRPQIADFKTIATPDSAANMAMSDTLFSDNNDFGSELTYAASDSMYLDVINNELHLYGDAEVNYQTINLKACYIVVNATKKTIKAQACTDSLSRKPKGLPTFTDGNETLTSRKISYNFETKKARVTDIVTQQGEGYLMAQDVKMINDSTFYIKNAFYTTCNETNHPHFGLNITKGKVIKNRTIIAGPAYLEVADIPLPIGIPFAYYPITEKKKSGVILPQYGQEATRGYFLMGGGYHFAINRRLALSLTGDLSSRGSWGLNPKITYHKRYKYRGGFAVRYSSLRLGNIDEIGYKPKKDFNINWNHSQDPRTLRNATFSASVNAGTSTFLQRTAFTTTQYAQNQLQSSVNFTKRFVDTKHPFQISGSLGHNQNTQTRQTNFNLPDVSVNGLNFFPFANPYSSGKKRFEENINISYNMNLKNNLNTYDSLLLGLLKGKQNIFLKLNSGISHNVGVNFGSIRLLKHINISPNANYTERWYFRKIVKSYDANTKKMQKDTVGDGSMYRVANYGFGVSMNTAVYGMYQLKMKKLPIKTIRHTMRPTVGFSYQPDFVQQYGYRVQTDSTGKNFQTFTNFDEGIFGTAPINGRVGGINFNLENNIEGKILRRTSDTSTTLEKVRLLDGLGINANYNFAADSNKLSNIVVGGRASLGKSGAGSSFGLVFSPYNTDSAGRIIAQYLWQADRKLAMLQSANLSFNYSINSQTINKNKTTAPKKDPDYPDSGDEYIQVPYNINIYYTLNYSPSRAVIKPQKQPKVISPFRQSFTVSGDTRLTDNWRIGFSTGYDITNKQVSPTLINIDRALHCWRLTAAVVPFGPYKSYMVSLQPISPMLSALKLNKSKSWYDNNR
jgi:hypothetical protein